MDSVLEQPGRRVLDEFRDRLIRRRPKAAISDLIDDREADARLGPALLTAGCSRADAQTFLAHVGPVPTALSVPGLTIEPATLTSNLEEYVVTKIKGFADSEAEPDPDVVHDQLALRRAELAA